jgi:hypothetical protein
MSSSKSRVACHVNQVRCVQKPYFDRPRAYGYMAYVYDDGVPRGSKVDVRTKIAWLGGRQGTNICHIWVLSLHEAVRSTNTPYQGS